MNIFASLPIKISAFTLFLILPFRGSKFWFLTSPPAIKIIRLSSKLTKAALVEATFVPLESLK